MPVLAYGVSRAASTHECLRTPAIQINKKRCRKIWDADAARTFRRGRKRRIDAFQTSHDLPEDTNIICRIEKWGGRAKWLLPRKSSRVSSPIYRSELFDWARHKKVSDRTASDCNDWLVREVGGGLYRSVVRICHCDDGFLWGILWHLYHNYSPTSNDAKVLQE